MTPIFIPLTLTLARPQACVLTRCCAVVTVRPSVPRGCAALTAQCALLLRPKRRLPPRHDASQGTLAPGGCSRHQHVHTPPIAKHAICCSANTHTHTLTLTHSLTPLTPLTCSRTPPCARLWPSHFPELAEEYVPFWQSVEALIAFVKGTQHKVLAPTPHTFYCCLWYGLVCLLFMPSFYH